MAHERLRPSFTFDEDRINELKKIAPECFADGKINWEVLKVSLGDYYEPDEDEKGQVIEHFGLFWPGKKESRKMVSIPSKGALFPVYGEGVRPNGNSDENGINVSENIFIEGENLEILKILQKSYAGKIKLIYIDPPYNTGNDFVYDDDFTEPIDEYLKRTGQIDGEGKPLTTNKKADGRFHSRWLSMMYPRLKLARNLLSEDGVMFVSIDDNEVHHLRQLINEIFGEECIEQYIWNVREEGTMPKTAKYTVRKEHEYILAGFKNSTDKKLEKYSEYKYKDNENWGNPDDDPRGPWMSGNISRGSGKATGGSKSYIITNPSGIEFNRDWSIDENEFKDLLKDNRIYFADNGKGVPRKKIFKNEPVLSIQSSLFENLESSQTGKKQINELLGDIDFDYPKPVKLIKRIIEITTKKDSIIMDFFAGSGTTMQSVIEMNAKDNGNRKFIGIQMAEKCECESKAFRAGYETIADISKDRIRKLISQLIETNSQDKTYKQLGFKVFKLGKTHFREWLDYSGNELVQLEAKFENFNNPLIENWKPENLLFEIILIEGFPLDSDIDSFKNNYNDLKKISSDFCNHSLVICFDEKIHTMTINQLDLSENGIFICFDSAITDQEKLRLSDIGLLKTI